MSSPFSPKTKRGTEETIEAIHQAITWLSRIDEKNHSLDSDIDTLMNDLRSDRENIETKYKIKTIEVALDNFVYNNIDTTKDILEGDLDSRVSAISELEEYIYKQFGYVNPIDLSMEEMIWLVSQELKHSQSRKYSHNGYDDIDLSETALQNMGERPETWSEEYPIYNR